MDIREPHVTALVRIRKLRVIESDQTKNSRIDIMDAKRRFLGAKAELVARSQAPDRLEYRRPPSTY